MNTMMWQRRNANAGYGIEYDRSAASEAVDKGHFCGKSALCILHKEKVMYRCGENRNRKSDRAQHCKGIRKHHLELLLKR